MSVVAKYLLGFCLISFLVGSNYLSLSSQNWQGVPVTLITPSEEYQEPIVISSDNDFVAQGWPGSGTPSDPFVIGGLTFKGSNLPYINITGVESFFVIESCSMQEPAESTVSNIGIILAQVADCRIQDNTFSGVSRAVHIRDAESCSVSNNQFTDIHGVDALRVEEVHIEKNMFQMSAYPVSCLEVEEFTMNDNIISQPEYVYVHSYYQYTRFEFSRNTIIGNLQFNLKVRDLNISNNDFIERTQPLEIANFLYSSSESRQYVFANNSLDSSGIEFSSYMSFDFLEYAVFRNNSVGGIEIPMVSNQNDQSFDCSDYPQVIAYKCVNVSFINAAFTRIGTGLTLASCENCTAPDIVTTNCSTGIYLDRCIGTSMDNFSSNACTEGIFASECSLLNLVDSSFIDCFRGMYLQHTLNATIMDNRFEMNEVGILLDETRYSFIVGNTFIQNRVHAEYRSVYLYPYDEWDDGAGNGNYWDDYMGIGPYFIYIGRWTVVDNGPIALLPFYSTPGGVLLIACVGILSGTVLFTIIGFFVSKRREGIIASELAKKNNWLLFLSAMVVLFTPQIFVWQEMPDWPGYRVKWWIASYVYLIWNEGGTTFVQSSLLFFVNRAIGYNIIFILFFLGTLFFILKKAWINARTENANTSMERYIVLLMIVMTLGILVFPISPSGQTYGFTPNPIPLAPLLIYPMLRTAKKDLRKGEDENNAPSPHHNRLICPHCRAVYWYDKKDLFQGVVICQNCGRNFGPRVNSKTASIEENGSD